MKLEMLLLQPWMFLLLVALLALVQAVWARSAKRWQGVILPVVYELFFARQTSTLQQHRPALSPGLLSVQYAVRFRHCPGTGILRGLVCMEVQAVNGCKPPT